MVKIKTYLIGKRGARGLVLAIPQVWSDDNGLKPGDRLDVYRDTQDRLILVPSKAPRRRRKAA